MNSSNNEESSDLDDAEYLNSKNHYDDPNADPSDLYGSVKDSSKYDNGAIEGADDPGIFVGLEIIDGSQYRVEKVSVGKGTNAGYVTRLIIDGDKGDSNAINMFEKIDGETGKCAKGEEKKLSRKERNKLKFDEIVAKRKERQLERKRKKDALSCGKPEGINADNGNDNQQEEAEDRKSKKKSKIAKVPQLPKCEPRPIVRQEDIHSIQSSWAIDTGGVYLHDKICASLHQMQFTSPTPIQSSTLAASILGLRDVVGAAPTGSVSYLKRYNLVEI